MNTIGFIDGIWCLFLLQIAIQDWKKRSIPKKCILGIFLCGMFRGFLLGKTGIIEGIAGIGIAFLLFFLILCIAPGSFGGGDIKLSMGNGWYLGVEQWVESFVIGVFLAALWILYERSYQKRGEEREIAFGPFLCLGAFFTKIL